MVVSDFMTPEPYCVNGREPLVHLMEVFQHHGVYQVPIVDEAGVLIGIVSDQDIRRVLARHKTISPRILVKHVMTPNPVTVIPSTAISDAIDILCESRFGALPVVVNQRVVGILCARDLLRRYAEKLREPARMDAILADSRHYSLSGRA